MLQLRELSIFDMVYCGVGKLNPRQLKIKDRNVKDRKQPSKETIFVEIAPDNGKKTL